MYGQGVKQGFLSYINKSVKHGLSPHLYSSWIFLHLIFLLHLYVPLGWTFKHSQDDFSVILRSLFFALFMLHDVSASYPDLFSTVKTRMRSQMTGKHGRPLRPALNSTHSTPECKNLSKTSVIWVSKHGKHRQFVWLASCHVETKQCPIWIFNFHPLIIDSFADGGSWNDLQQWFSSFYFIFGRIEVRF